MLQIKNIKKEYKTGGLVQKALDDVSLNLRDNEFVAILGPSGSGKTTLLNIIGGLDRYDSGDLVINGISTKRYKDRDWDSYRNHTIGFVFQSYNLIPHQTVLSNVELALTISGVSKSQRREIAKEALEKVGLIKHIHKKPNQLSGGQMQRVAIARALVNDPDIVLADEPTGALDSETSVQVMELLKEVAKDRLVVMVTHNPELAEEYATRIVTLKDGKILDDTDRFDVSEADIVSEKSQNMGKTSMSFLTSLSLSFNNLKTKKGRTILTAFAGSIGIIGIALILSLSNGINNYINDIEEETLSEYPLQIQKAGYDMSSLFRSMSGSNSKDSDSKKTKEDMRVQETLTGMFSTVGSNDLKSLKKYFDSGKSGIEKHTKAIEYSYGIEPQIYSADTDNIRQVHPDKSFSAMGLGSESTTNSMMSSMMSTNVFMQMPENKSLYQNQYDVKAGKWPSKYNECVLVLYPDGSISDYFLYALNLRDPEELDKMVKQFAKEEEVKIPEGKNGYSYEEVLNAEFRLVNAADCYQYDSSYKVWKDKKNDEKYMKSLVEKGEKIKIVGIVQPKKDASISMLMPGIYYTPELSKHVIEKAYESEIVKQQLKNEDINVFTGKEFNSKSSEGGFDMKSLFKVDESKFASAFQMDPSRINVDLSNLNNLMGQVSLPGINISDIISKIDINISTEQINSMISDLAAGYMDYVKNRPEMDFSALDIQVMSYLNSPQVEKLLIDQVEQAIKENGEIKLTDSQMKEILNTIIDEFYKYSEENNLPDIMKMGQYFMEYIQTDEAKKIINKHLDEIARSNSIEEQIYSILKGYMGSVTGSISSALEKEITNSMRKLSASMANAFKFDMSTFSGAMNMDMSEEEIMELMTAMMYQEDETSENNLKKLGYADFSNPSEISIYPKDFEEKEKVIDILDSYNERMEKAGRDDQVISYTDMVGSLMSSVTTIINAISYVLVAFVAISLVVSSIMIGVITYISVLERKKEIGVLRAIGASKKNISQVFNAETFIIGALSGIIGIGMTIILIVPINQIIHSVTGKDNINAALPIFAGIVLIVISILLTLIGGIIPSRKAAKEDPVTALRTE